MYFPLSTSGQLPAGSFVQLAPEHLSRSLVELLLLGQYEAAATCEKKRRSPNSPWSMPTCSVGSRSQTSVLTPQSHSLKDPVQEIKKIEGKKGRSHS